MKKLTLLTLTLLSVYASIAQTGYGVATISGRSSGELKTYKYAPKGTTSEITLLIENFYGDIELVGVGTGDLVIETSDYEGVPEKAQGLKPLSASGTENTGIGLNVVQEGNVIKVTAASRKADGDYTFKVPKNMKVNADLKSWQSGDLVATGLSNEVEVQTQNGDIMLRNITGPVVANTLSGDVDIIFSTVSQTTPTSITSTSGDIDVTLPASTKGSFKLSTISGEIYTDMNFDVKNENGLTRMAGGMSADANLNGGGVSILLKSISGDVYIRKSN